MGKLINLYIKGCCTGAVLFGTLASHFGRNRLFTVTLLLYTFSVIGVAITTNYYLFIIFRFLTGL